MSKQNYFVCPRCGQVHDVDPKPEAEYGLSLSIQRDPLAVTELLADGNRERERLWKNHLDIVLALKDVVGQDAAMCSSEHLPALIRTLRLPVDGSEAPPLPLQQEQGHDENTLARRFNGAVPAGDPPQPSTGDTSTPLKETFAEMDKRIAAEVRRDEIDEGIIEIDEDGHVSLPRCACGVRRGVSHYCSALEHAWIGRRLAAAPSAPLPPPEAPNSKP